MADNLTQPTSQDYGPNNDIDLVALVEILLEGRWTIIGVTGLACALALASLLLVKTPFEATTVIRPISTIVADEYAESNALEFFEVSEEDLESLFIENLRGGRVLRSAAERIPLFERERYKSDAEYQEKILEFVESVQLLPPVNEDGSERGMFRPNWEMVVEYNDKEKWLLALRYLQEQTSKDIGDVLRARFTTAITVAKQAREFELQDLTTKVENVKADYEVTMTEFATRLAFDLEDVNTKIENALADYDRATSDRLAFLKEQAAIARKLGVAKNTIEAQTFSAQGGVLASVETDTPFYLRGYEAIEKEIELMESREDKRAFVAGLVALEQKKRELEQDQTLARKEREKQFLEEKLELERQIREREQDQTLERAQVLFEETPIGRGEDFVAARFVPEGTEFKARYSNVMILVLVGLLSGMLSCVYVLISSALRNRPVSESQADA